MKDEKPKLQNTPVRTEEARELRRVFVEHQQPMLEADYSALERRALREGQALDPADVLVYMGDVPPDAQPVEPPVEGEVIGRDEVPQGCGQCPACLANAARRDAQARAGGPDGVVLLIGPPSRGGGLLELLLGRMVVVDASPPNEGEVGRPARGLPPGDYLAKLEPADLEPVIRRFEPPAPPDPEDDRRFEPPAPPDPEDDRKRVRGPNLSRREMLARQRQHGEGKRGR